MESCRDHRAWATPNRDSGTVLSVKSHGVYIACLLKAHPDRGWDRRITTVMQDILPHRTGGGPDRDSAPPRYGQNVEDPSPHHQTDPVDRCGWEHPVIRL